MTLMAEFFHIVERSDGRWVCHHGNKVDYYLTLTSAVQRIRLLTGEKTRAEIFVHHLTGGVTRLGPA